MMNILKRSKEKVQGDASKPPLTPQQIQKRKKMLVYPLFFLLFAGAMWLIFTPSPQKEKMHTKGFNAELPIPKDEGIVGDKREAYQQEDRQKKQQEKMRSLQDFAFMFGEKGGKQGRDETMYPAQTASFPSGDSDHRSAGEGSKSNSALRSSATAYRTINRQLSNWYDEPEKEDKKQEQSALATRVQELERKLDETKEVKNTTDEQMDLMEKSYQLAAKYIPNMQGGSPSGKQKLQPADNTGNNTTREKVLPRPVSQVCRDVVSLLSSGAGNQQTTREYNQPRNTGFLTVGGNTEATEKNGIRACVYQAVTLSDGKELQLRLLEPLQAGNVLIPENTVLKGSAKISGERLQITVSSIQYADNVIPVELSVYDMDGMQGIFIPNSDEVNAVKEVAAGMGSSMGSGITISANAGSQLAADVGRSAIQGVSQYVSKKMQTVKVTLKTGYKVLLLPKS